MAHLTSIFIVLAFITALNCAPVDESSVYPPAIAFSTTASTTAVPSSTTEQRTASKRQTTKEDSFDSRESDESSEANNKRPARDTENSGVVAHEAKQDSSTFGLIQTSSPVTKQTPTPQLPTRERRGVYYDGSISPGAYAATSQSTTTGAITSSTTYKPNY